MTRSQKVLWSEGLFLTPQHFQRWDRYYEDLVDFRLRSVTRFTWGVDTLEVNREALDNGVFELLRCKAVLPDGLPLDVPDVDAPPPSRIFTNDFSPSSERLPVYLGIPVIRANAANLTEPQGASQTMMRYVSSSEPVPDENTGDNPQPVSFALKNLRLLFGDEAVQNHVALKVAELRRTPEARVVLDDQFIPPAVTLTAAKALTDIVRRLLEKLSAKSSTLAARRRQKGADMADFTTSDVANFWLLHTVNSYLPLVLHFHNVQRIHPEELYLAMARLAGELITFVTEGHPAELPKYAHMDLGKTFAELDLKVSILLDTVVPERCVAIPLDRTKESLYVGRVTDDRLLTHAELFLAVSARMPEPQLIERVPRKSKIASLDTINFLLGQALPGVLLRPVPVPPGPIPTRVGFKYFRLEKLGSYWDTIVSSRNICIYFPAEFPELRLELFAVKE
jgi:type VI secretion system protein ImpJ